MDIKSTAQLFGIYSKPPAPAKKHTDNLYFGKDKSGVEYLKKIRGFNHKTIQHFQLGLNEKSEITIPIFKGGQLIDYKYRGIAEKTFSRHPGSENWVINEVAFDTCQDAGYIILVEGEYDAIALWQLGFKNVVSTTGGVTGPTPWVKNIPENVKVYIFYDNDEPGQDAARKLADRLGIQRCYNIVLSVKDANDFLLAGGTTEQFQEILNKAERFKIQNVYKISEVIDALEKNKLPRVPVFSKRITEHMLGGIPSKSLVVVSGDTNVGKSTALLNFLTYHADKQKKPVLLISLENDIYFTVQRILEIKMGKPHTSFTKEDWLAIRSEMMDYPFYIDVSMEAYSLDRLEKIVDQAKKLYGIEFLGFDHIGFLPTRDDPKEISQMMRGLKLMSRSMDIITYVVSHVSRGQEKNSTLNSSRLKGSSSIGQDSDIVLFVVPTRAGHEIWIDKARMSQGGLRIPIIFDGNTGLMSDDYGRNVMRFEEVVEDVQRQEVSLPEDNSVDY